jgi:hypothetical protein
MAKQFKRISLVLVAVCAVGSASAFSLLGPLTAWQSPPGGPGIGYNPYGTDIGGPMNLGEEYRWNIPTIYYGYDESFLNYFGTEGTNAIEKAIAIINALPKMSQTSANLDEFPMDTRRVNYRASALNLIDLKSYTLAGFVEMLGLASPERYTWTLRNVTDDPIYTVIKRNFDPVTFSPSSFVNGTLYTYVIQDPVFLAPAFADAVEIQVDPLQFGYSAVASGFGSFYTPSFLGEFYTGLTRDDVGGLRYLYRTNNYQFENLLAGTTGSGLSASGSPWTPIGGTNVVSTNSAVDLAVRPGVDKITFKRANYDSLIGSFIITTNSYTDKFVTNSTVKSQTVQRTLQAPDLLFAAEDLGLVDGSPIRLTRTDSSGWINNDAINGQATLDGPGVITPQKVFTYSKIGPFYFNLPPGFMDELQSLQGAAWGNFDGSTNEPIVFPVGTSIQELEQQVLSGNGGSGVEGSPWTVANVLVVTTNAP